MKAGYVTIFGLPNVGKSTLLNKIIGQKLSIVSNKPQTTRHRIIGILTEGDIQAIFTDTPGYIKPTYQLQKVMVAAVNKAIVDTDLILWLVSAIRKPSEDDKKLSYRLNKKQTILAINKIDLIPKENILPLIDFYKNLGIVEIYPISALYGDGVSELKEKILNSLPENAFYYPEDMLTHHPERFFVSEIIREKIFDFYEKEIPYATSVGIDEFKERENGKYYIRAVVYVERESQKRIVIGQRGEKLKKVGIEARKAIERLIDHSVYLDLWVKVKEKWRKKLEKIKELGYHS